MMLMTKAVKTLCNELNHIAVPAYKTIICHVFQFERISPESLVDDIFQRTREVVGDKVVGGERQISDGTIIMMLQLDEVKVFIIGNLEENELLLCSVGPAGNCGEMIWNQVSCIYNSILNDIENIITTQGIDSNSFKRSIMCPDCLVNPNMIVLPNKWSRDHILKHVDGNHRVQCSQGHTIELQLLLGPSESSTVTNSLEDRSSSKVWNSSFPNPKWEEKLSGVVLVLNHVLALDGSYVQNYGSGFIACAKRGLIITAGHIIFDMTTKTYPASKGSTILIGMHRDRESDFVDKWYSAEVVAKDLQNADVCVLGIKNKMVGEAMIPIKIDIEKEKLQALTSTSDPPQKDTLLTLVGFKQTGLEIADGRTNYTTCISRGYLEKESKTRIPLQQGGDFLPDKEIVVRDCPNYDGQSGGPMFDEHGNVVGILSRGDVIDKNMCYLVPHDELDRLLQEIQTQEMKITPNDTIFVLNQDANVKEIMSSGILRSGVKASNSRSGGNSFEDMVSAIKGIDHLQSQLLTDPPKKTATEVVNFLLKEKMCTFVSNTNKIIKDDNEIEVYVLKQIKKMKGNMTRSMQMTKGVTDRALGERHSRRETTPTPQHSTLVPNQYWSSKTTCNKKSSVRHEFRFNKPTPDTVLLHLRKFPDAVIFGNIHLIDNFFWKNAMYLKFFERIAHGDMNGSYQAATEIFIEINQEQRGLVLNAKWHIEVKTHILNSIVQFILRKLNNPDFHPDQLNVNSTSSSNRFTSSSDCERLKYIVCILQRDEIKGTGVITETGLVVTSFKNINEGDGSVPIYVQYNYEKLPAKMISIGSICVLKIENIHQFGNLQGIKMSQASLNRDTSISVQGLIQQDDGKIKDSCKHKSGGYLCMVPKYQDFFVIHCYRSHYSCGSPVFDGNGKLIGIINDFWKGENYRYYVKSAITIQMELNVMKINEI